jgi:hypothetical protein
VSHRITLLELAILALWLGAPILLLGAGTFGFLTRKRLNAPWSRVAIFSIGWFVVAFTGELVLWASASSWLNIPERVFMLFGIINTPALVSVVLLLVISSFTINRRSKDRP